MDDYNKKQLELVEFSEMVYHSGLRNKGINGSLYEDRLIQLLRNDIPEFSFFKGQIRINEKSSSQFDVIICNKETRQLEFLKDISETINVVNKQNCLGVIELKKWGNPQMISNDGVIQKAYESFKTIYPELKYYFVCLRFKDRKNKTYTNWHKLEKELKTDGNFCFWGRVDKQNEEWNFPWINNLEYIQQNKIYFGEYERLVETIKNVAQQGV